MKYVTKITVFIFSLSGLVLSLIVLCGAPVSAQESVQLDSGKSLGEIVLDGELTLDDAFLTAVDLHSRLACEAYKIDEIVDSLSLKILRLRRALKKERVLSGRIRSRLAVLERDSFGIRSLRVEGRTPLAGGSCPYKPPYDTSYLPE